MRIMQHLWSSLLRTEIRKIIPSHLRLRAPAYFLALAILMLLLAAAGTAFAGSATWNLNPTSGEWNTAANWTPPTIPNGPEDTATFGISNGTFIYFEITGFEVNGIVFNAGASAFTFDFYNTSFTHLFTVSGVGITNNSGITQNFALVDGGDFVAITFKNSATAGDLTVFTTQDSLTSVQFQDASTAGNATLVANSGFFDGGLILFFGDSTGGTARVEVFGAGSLDISAHNAPGVTVGSIEGDGLVFLGANNLTVGSNNLSTIFSGLIQNAPGSLTKIGTGTLVLTNPNSYTGGTTIHGGRLWVNNRVGTGSGPVMVNAGTLGGTGSIAGAVTVGTGSGIRARLAPARLRGQPGITLTIQSTLTLKSDATYEVGLNSVHAVADKVVAAGVTIDSGAHFSVLGSGQSVLTPGTVFTVIDNTSGTPIAGTFSNLGDEAIITAGGANFQASYEGGDGNDLTLTVIP